MFILTLIRVVEIGLNSLSGQKKNNVNCLQLFSTSFWFNLFYFYSIGYYCPENSGSATPCPAGTYNRDEGKTSVSDCLECWADHFNHLTGQKACLTCGGEAEQPNTGQTTCICKGGGKDFQACYSLVLFLQDFELNHRKSSYICLITLCEWTYLSYSVTLYFVCCF